MKAGFHPDIDAATYHGDPCPTPSLSSSLAKTIIHATPRHAWTKHPRLNPDFEAKEDDKFSLGTVFHEFALGKGGGYLVLGFDNWTTKAAKEAREAARESGKTPLLAKDFDRVALMHERATERLAEMGIDIAASFQRDRDRRNEAVLTWQEKGGIWCRSMLDSYDAKNVTIDDLKTTGAGLDDNAITRTILNLDYDLSAAFYLRGLAKVDPSTAGKAKFRWIFVEIDPPHEVRVIEPSATHLAIGARKAALAIEKWARCSSTDQWPGYPARVDRLEPQGYFETGWLAQEQIDPDAANCDFGSL